MAEFNLAEINKRIRQDQAQVKGLKADLAKADAGEITISAEERAATEQSLAQSQARLDPNDPEVAQLIALAQTRGIGEDQLADPANAAFNSLSFLDSFNESAQKAAPAGFKVTDTTTAQELQDAIAGRPGGQEAFNTATPDTSLDAFAPTPEAPRPSSSFARAPQGQLASTTQQAPQQSGPSDEELIQRTMSTFGVDRQTAANIVASTASSRNRPELSRGTAGLGAAQAPGGLQDVFDLFNQEETSEQKAFRKQQQQTLDRLIELEKDLAKANTPSAELTSLRNQIREQQSVLQNLTPRTFLESQPGLKDVGISQQFLSRRVAQEREPIALALSNMLLSESILGEQQQQEISRIQNEQRSLQNISQLRGAIQDLQPQEFGFGDLPGGTQSKILNEFLFPEKGKDFTLAPGSTRFDSEGNVIARGERTSSSRASATSPGSLEAPRGGLSDNTGAILDGLNTLDKLTPTARAEVTQDLSDLGYASSTPPKWFVDQLQSERQQSLLPEVVQKAWDDHTREVLTGGQFITPSYLRDNLQEGEINQLIESAGVEDLSELMEIIQEWRDDGYTDRDIEVIMGI